MTADQYLAARRRRLSTTRAEFIAKRLEDVRAGKQIVVCGPPIASNWVVRREGER